MLTVGVWIAGLVALAVTAMLGIEAILRVGNRLFGPFPAGGPGPDGDIRKQIVGIVAGGVHGDFKLSMLGFSMTAKGPVGKVVFIALLGYIPTANSLAYATWLTGLGAGFQTDIPLIIDGVESVLTGSGGDSSVP